MNKYRLTYRWNHHGPQRHQSVTGITTLFFELAGDSDFEARTRAVSYCKQENPGSLKRSYQILGLQKVDQSEKVIKILI